MQLKQSAYRDATTCISLKIHTVILECPVMRKVELSD
jgi:hypothetical protein